MEEDFVCTLLLPAEGRAESIQMTGDWSLLEVMSAGGHINPSPKSMSDMVRILRAGTADPQVFADYKSEQEQPVQIAFLVHDDICIWTLLPNLDQSTTYANLQICDHHSICITGPTLVCGAEYTRFAQSGSFRSLLRPLYTLEVEHIEKCCIKWGEHGGTHLVPFRRGGYRDMASTMEKHWMFPHDDSSPTPSLNDILKKG